MPRPSRWLPPVIALALTVALFWPVLLSDRYLVSGHDVLWNYLAASFYRYHLFADGAIPLWDSYVFSGIPFYQYVSTYLVYPLGYLVYALPMVTAINYLYILPLLVAAATMFAYGQSRGLGSGGAMVAALAYAFGGCFLIRVWAGHLEIVNAFAYLPLLFLLAERLARRADILACLLFGLALGLVTSFGNIQIPAIMFMGLGLYGLWSLPAFIRLERGRALRMAALFMLAAAIGLGLSAIYWLPSYEFAELSNRSGGASYEFATRNSLRPQDLITLLFPDLLGHEASGNWWGPAYSEAAFYVGVATALLAAFAIPTWRRDRFVASLTALAAVSLVLALGRFTPAYGLLFAIPPFNMAQEPWRFVQLFAFALALLGGIGYWRVFGVARREEGPAIGRLWSRIVLAYGIFAVLLLAAPRLLRWGREPILAVGGWVIAHFYYGRPGHPLSLAEYAVRLEVAYVDTAARLDAIHLGNPAVVLPLVLGLATLGLIGVALKWRQHRGGVGVAIVVLLALDLYIYGATFVQPLDAWQQFREQDFVAFLRQDAEPHRIFPMEGASVPFEENDGELFHIQSIDGYASFLLRRYQEFVNAANSRPLSYFDALGTEWREPASKLVDLLNVKYVLGATAEPPPKANYELAFRGDDVAVYRRQPYVPRANIVYRYRLLPDGEAILAALADPAFDPRREVLLEAEPSIATASEADTILGHGVVKLLTYSPNRLELTAEAAGDAFLVLSEIYYPGWRAYVDGRETGIYRANYTFRAVALGPGQHRVELVFQPATFYVGAAVSAATLLVSVAVLGVCLWRRSR